jgi:predicted ATPase
MLTNLSLKNIKSFNEDSTLQIAPITLIYGPNSAGKSSLWKFFLALRENTRYSSRSNFLDLNRSDFANLKTLSFDRTKESSFSLNFSKNSKKDKSTYFSFNFVNPGSKISTYEIEDIVNDPSILKKFEKYGLTEKDRNDMLIGMKKIFDEQIKIKNKSLKTKEPETVAEAEQMAREEREREQAPSFLRDEKIEGINNNLKIKNLEIVQEKRNFITFKIVELPKIDTGGRGILFGRTRKVLGKQEETNIRDILINHYKENFSGESGLVNKKFEFEAKVKTSKKLYNEFRDGEFKLTRVFDMMGPNGPKEFKHDSARLIRYLFLPTKISKDPEIWRKYYDFLQFLKGKMIDNHKGKKDKSKKQIFQSYVDEHWVLRALSMEDNYGVDPEDIPQLKETYKKILRAMDSDLNEFIDILSEDLETFIMLGYSFLPEQRFYGGFVFRVLFDLIPEKFLDSYLGNFDESGKLQPPTKEGTEFIEKIEQSNSTSIVEQLRNLFNFHENLSKFKKSNFNSPFSIGSPGSGTSNMSRFLFNGIHENPEYKKKIISFLDKIDLPFEITSKSDESGNIRLTFENKRISKINNEIKEIPLEQSGNALKSILLLLADISRSEGSVIILEEPENKLHPKIQGNLIELLADVIVEKDNSIIIETHSEHFLLRIQKLIRENKLDPDDVAINYVFLDEDGTGSKIDHMQIDKQGEFINTWRHGFFNERLREI